MATELVNQRQTPTRPQGRDELNLIDFPIATLQHQQPVGKDGKPLDELVSVVESYDADQDKVVPRKLTKRTSSKHGFPTPLEEEVLIALLSITRYRNDFTSPRAEFHNRELFDLMNWPNNGESSRRLAVALDRLTGLKLKYENSWGTDGGTFQKVFQTGILESSQLIRQTRGQPRAERERSWIQWSSEVFSDIQRGNVKELDTEAFFSLELPISQKMYRFLDHRLATSPQFEIELKAFAAHIGLAEVNHIGKIKERLAPAIAELEALPDFIEAWSPQERYTKRGPGDWLIHFRRPQKSSEPQQDHQPTEDGNRRTPEMLDAADRLVAGFYRLWSDDEHHRINSNERRQAQEVVDRYGADRSLELLPVVIRLLKRGFPDARAFGAARLFWQDAAKSLARKEKRTAIDERTEAESAQSPAEQKVHDRLLAEWHQLNATQQQQVLNSVRKSSSPALKRLADEKGFDDPLVRIHCLQVLGRQQDTGTAA